MLSGAGQRNNGLGIVALNDGERFSDFRDTLKNLLNLANITQTQMRERLLMLAGLPTDHIAINAHRILGEDYEQLSRERIEFKQFKSHQNEVQHIIQLFNDRRVLWGQLNYRWQDLKARKQKFDEAHTKQIEGLDGQISSISETFKTTKGALELKRGEEKNLIGQKSPVESKIKELEVSKKAYGAFAEQLEDLALANLERQLNDLINRQKEASTETVESVRDQLSTAEIRAKATTKSIQHFSRLVVTAMREQHFTEDEISRLFGILNPDLLGLVVGRGGITLSNSKEVIARLRDLVSRINDGVYQDGSMTIKLGPPTGVLSKFQNVDALEKQLERDSNEVKRLAALLEAVTKRDETAASIESLKTQKQAQANKLAAYRLFLLNLAKENEWRDAVKTFDGLIIWLCQNHAKMIDDDEVKWTISELRAIKQAHERDVHTRIGLPPQTATHGKENVSTPREFAFAFVRELIPAYRAILEPMLRFHELKGNAELGLLMCGVPLEPSWTKNRQTPWTVFVRAEWLRWILSGQSAGFPLAQEIPPKQIYGQIPGWPDTFLEFLQAMVQTNTTFQWRRSAKGFLILAQ